MSEILDPRSGGPVEQQGFAEIVQLIDACQGRALQAVNTVLIDLYWQIGQSISRRLAASEWGEGTVDRLAQFIAQAIPGVRGFSRPNLFRMRQFYEAYKDSQIVSPTGETIALVSPPHHSGAEQKAGRARVLHAHGGSGTLDKAPA